MQSKLAFHIGKAENSVSSEEYKAAVAERDAAIAMAEAKDRLHAVELASMEARHAAFMYSIVESCRMNDIDFGHYIETVLSRIQDGDIDFHGMLPNVITLPRPAKTRRYTDDPRKTTLFIKMNFSRLATD